LKNLSDEVRDSSISHSREIPRFARNDAVVQEDSSISHSREIPHFVRNDTKKIVIAEYPYVNSNYAPTPTYLFWQRYHQKPMINGQPEPDTTGKEKIRHLIYDVTSPRTPKILKKLGATYLILHKDEYNKPYEPGGAIPPDKRLPRAVKMTNINPRFKLVQRFGMTYVYEIK
ncbi:MAG: hypothetical protein AB1465_07455, partial [Patescibacteria group bacterium]